jgi:putative spermidine/putrescine transport system permease protein
VSVAKPRSFQPTSRAVRSAASTRGGAALAALVALPVLIGVLYALAGALGLVGLDAHGFTTEHVTRVLGAGATWRGIGWSLATATVATAAATVVSMGLAVTFRGTRVGDRVARTLAAVPLPMPHIVAATLGLLVLSQSGLLARLLYALGVIHSAAQMPALVLDPLGIGYMATMAWKEVPFLGVVGMSVIATRGPRLEEVARTLGATSRQTLWRVTVPILWRGMAPAAIAVAIVIAGSFEGAYLLAPSHPLALPLLTYEQYRTIDVTRRADAYVLVLVGLSLSALAVMALEWVRARWDAE